MNVLKLVIFNIKNRLREIIAMPEVRYHYPENSLKFLEKRKQTCLIATQNLCKHVDEIKNNFILEYVTSGCEIRRVISADIDNDINRMRLNGLTEADLLEHSLLKDLIEVCSGLRKNDFFWHFKAVSAKGCKKKQK